MAEAVQQLKRQTKPGTHRLTVTLSEAGYQKLEKVAAEQMREPKNMLSFILKERLEGVLQDYIE